MLLGFVSSTFALLDGEDSPGVLLLLGVVVAVLLLGFLGVAGDVD